MRVGGDAHKLVACVCFYSQELARAQQQQRDEEAARDACMAAAAAEEEAKAAAREGALKAAQQRLLTEVLQSRGDQVAAKAAARYALYKLSISSHEFVSGKRRLPSRLRGGRRWRRRLPLPKQSVQHRQHASCSSRQRCVRCLRSRCGNGRCWRPRQRRVQRACWHNSKHNKPTLTPVLLLWLLNIKIIRNMRLSTC